MSIKTINLNKKFLDQVIFENLNIEIKKGRFNAVIGTSGRGKTTLLNILMGLDRDYSGKVEIEKLDMSVVFQENRLLESLSIYENINFVLEKDFDSDFINRHLNMVGLDIDCSKKVNKLSGGMKRRVAILRCILKKADIYILDEPFKEMDDDSYKKVLDYTKKYLYSKTVIFTTHRLDEISFFDANVINL